MNEADDDNTQGPDLTSEVETGRQSPRLPARRRSDNKWQHLMEQQNKNFMALLQTLNKPQPSTSKELRLPDFDPDKQDVDARAWISTADLCIDDPKCQGPSLMIALSRALKNRASTWLSRVAYPGMNWSDFKDIFTARYDSSDTNAAFLIDLHSKKPDDKECLAAYASNLMSSIMSRWNGLTTEQIAIATVLAHISRYEPRVQRLSFTTDIKTRSQLQQELKAVSFSKRKSTSNNIDDEPDTKKTRIAGSQTNVKCFYCGKLGHRSPQCWLKREGNQQDSRMKTDALTTTKNQATEKLVTCYTCRQPGHFSYNCPKRSNQEGSNRETNSSKQKRVDVCVMDAPTGLLRHNALTLLAAAAALPAELPDPGELVFILNEDDWDDYLDAWLANEEQKWGANATSKAAARSGCTFNVNGDLGQPQPVYLRNGNYLSADDNSGQIRLNSGEQVTIACTGSGRTIAHPNLATSGLQSATATCANGNLVAANWLSGNSAFGGLTCSAHPTHEAIGTNNRCYNNNLLIQVGFIVNGWLYPLYVSCFDQNRLEVLYVVYEQKPANTVHQTGVDRPSWLAGSWFPGLAVNTAYTQVQQKIAIANAVGQAQADKYVTSLQFLARGHLAAKSDYVYATGQRATFWFINAAPQWQPFNAGNWNWLEQNARRRIGVAGYNTVIYTGTFGVTQLRDGNNVLRDIYLHRDANNNPQLPVPLYYYKVIYDESRSIGTAFVSINNPWYTEAEVRALTFCTDRCRNNAAFNWIGWQPDRIDLGYSFCCDINDFRRTVPHLPAFTVNGLLT